MKLFITLFAALFALFIVSCGSSDKTSVDNNGTPDETVTDDTVVDTNVTDDVVTDTAVTDDTAVDTTVTDTVVTDTQTNDEQTDDLLDGDTEQSDEDTVDPLKAQFVGTWAERLILKSDTSTLIGNVSSTTTRYKLGKISIEDGELKIDQKICKIDNVTDQGNTLFYQTYCDIYWFWRPGELSIPKSDITVADNGGTISFVENRSWELRGMEKMTNPETDTMPSSGSDARIMDQDEDGHPAFTLGFSGGIIGSAQLYLVQRLSHELSGTLVSEGRIEGGVNWTDDQYTVDATNVTLKGQKTSIIDNDHSSFIYLKVADDFTCDQVVDDLFN